jgi:uncharacterized damage-inducible protein DinB
MARATILATRIERTVTGPMWHGPALTDLLDGVPHDRAAAKPIAGAHSIWEIVLHVTAWAEIARLRLAGQATGDPTPEQDWPPPGSDPQFGSDPASSDPASAWHLAVERLGASHVQLAAATRDLTDDELDARVRGLEHTVEILLAGVIEHGTYHGGQIALLRRAAGADPGRPSGGASSAPTTATT